MNPRSGSFLLIDPGALSDCRPFIFHPVGRIKQVELTRPNTLVRRKITRNVVSERFPVETHLMNFIKKKDKSILDKSARLDVGGSDPGGVPRGGIPAGFEQKRQ
jgi:hypothetical protein